MWNVHFGSDPISCKKRGPGRRDTCKGWMRVGWEAWEHSSQRVSFLRATANRWLCSVTDGSYRKKHKQKKCNLHYAALEGCSKQQFSLINKCHCFCCSRLIKYYLFKCFLFYLMLCSILCFIVCYSNSVARMRKTRVNFLAWHEQFWSIKLILILEVCLLF